MTAHHINDIHDRQSAASQFAYCTRRILLQVASIRRSMRRNKRTKARNHVCRSIINHANCSLSAQKKDLSRFGFYVGRSGGDRAGMRMAHMCGLRLNHEIFMCILIRAEI